MSELYSLQSTVYRLNSRIVCTVFVAIEFVKIVFVLSFFPSIVYYPQTKNFNVLSINFSENYANCVIKRWAKQKITKEFPSHPARLCS